jgi:zeta-carotene desaturase
MRTFAFSPILGVHLAFDRAVMNRPHAVLVPAGREPATQWLFRKDAQGTKLHAVISAADEWMDLSEQQIGDRVLADVRAHLPAARDAHLVTVRSVKEKRATFAATCEGERARPAATGPSGIFLAGDYTATGWPATMEGAARSGYLAADAVLTGAPPHSPRANAGLVADLPRVGLARWLVR